MSRPSAVLAILLVLAAGAGSQAAIHPEPADIYPASLGPATVSPLQLSLETPIPVRRLHVEAYGPSCEPVRVTTHVAEGESTAHRVEIRHGGLLSVAVAARDGSELALRLYGPSGRLVAVSSAPGSRQALAVRLPADGTWHVEVEGVRVPSGRTEIELIVDTVQGSGVEVAGTPEGPVAAGEPIPIAVHALTEAGGCATPRVLLVFGSPGGETEEMTLVLPASEPRRAFRRVATTTASR